MKKTITILLLVLIFSIFACLTCVHATSINMDIDDDTSYNESLEEEDYDDEDTENEEETNTTNDESNNTSSQDTTKNVSTSPSVTTVGTSSSDQEFFTIENILACFIIVIGLILIFLGIAIMIRSK